MKRLFLFVSIFSILIPAVLKAQTKWEKDDLRKVLVKAKVLERNIFINVHSDNPTSVRLNHEVFEDKDGGKLSDRFFCLNYDTSTKSGKAIVKKFNIITFPQSLLLDKNGNEIDRIIHYDSAGDLIGKIFDYSESKSDIKTLENNLAENSKDIKVLFTLGEKYAYRGMESKANEYLGKVVELDSKNSKGYSDKALYILAKYLYLMNQKNYSRTMSLFLELENLYPGSIYAKNADLERANVFIEQNKKKEAFSSLQSFILKNKEDKSARPHLEYAKFIMKNDFHIDEGLEIAKEGVELNPKADALFNTMAELYAEKKEYNKAVNAMRKAVEIRPDDPHYKMQLDRFIKERANVKTTKKK